MPQGTVYLVDGTSLCYRSFFAIKLSNSQGMPTGSVYGSYQTLKKIISKYRPVYMGVCFDVSRKTFRQEKFKQYKIQRPPLPEDLLSQIPLVRKLISYLGMRIIEKEGFEADDVIASLCKNANDEGLSVIIVSSDKDLYQLMTSKEVSIYNYHKDLLIDRDSFIKENGFLPEEIVEYLSLAGDSTDNIPGARGIGKVGAAKLIKEFKTVENIFANLDKLPEKMQGILQENKDNIFLSRDLVKLEFPDLGINRQDLKIGEINAKGLYEMFSQLEFKTFLKDIPAPTLELGLEVSDTIPKGFLEAPIKDPLPLFIEGSKVFIYDCNKNCIYKQDTSQLENVLRDKTVKKLSHGLKQMLCALDFAVEGIYFDTKIAAYLLDSSFPDYDLERLVAHYLESHTQDIPSRFKPYFIYKLYELFLPKLKEQALDKLFFEVEMPLIYVLSQMQKQGVKVRVETLEELLKQVEIKARAQESAVFKAAGHQFNLNSPKQLSTVLFQELGIAPLKKTKTSYSTNEEVLETLSLAHPIAKEIIEYRHLNKLKNTYLEPLIEEVKKHKARLKAQFNQTKAQTGRLSSSEPNLQSIPSRGEFSLALRKAFISGFPRGCILSGDYSQIELRILAHLSKDQGLIKTFQDNLDIHRHTASLLFGKGADKVSDLERDLAKKVNFGIIYGMSAYGLAKELKISDREAENFISDYFRRYPGVENYIKSLQDEARRCGFVTTILGRQRRLPEINSPNIQLREFALRQAINAPIQGSSADIIKVAMVAIYNELRKRKLEAKLIIQIHDELIFDLPQAELEQVSVLLRQLMERSLTLDIPLKVNLKAGQSWGELKEV